MHRHALCCAENDHEDVDIVLENRDKLELI